MRDGRYLIGYGMAVATFPGTKFGGACKVRLNADGTALVSTAAHDLGTGAYTVFTQAAAVASLMKVRFELLIVR